jgi:glycine/betaine/sarcosine/D-proline reductase family selenoprotein B
VPIAERLGVPRVVRTRGIPYPAGDATVDPASEHAWRRRLMETALEALETAVSETTVFEPEQRA